MNFKNLKVVAISSILLGLSNTAFSAEFWRTGTVIRILSDSKYYGGCMVNISSNIANGCPNNGWVSLDCSETFYQGQSKNNMAIVLTALATNKRLSLKVDNSKKHDGYCIARRVDIIK